MLGACSSSELGEQGAAHAPSAALRARRLWLARATPPAAGASLACCAAGSAPRRSAAFSAVSRSRTAVTVSAPPWQDSPSCCQPSLYVGHYVPATHLSAILPPHMHGKSPLRACHGGVGCGVGPEPPVGLEALRPHGRLQQHQRRHHLRQCTPLLSPCSSAALLALHLKASPHQHLVMHSGNVAQR